MKHLMKHLISFKDKSINQKNPTIYHYENGQKEIEIYNLNGKLHREDGPAYQSWHESGQKNLESYYLNGKLHRENGPAYKSSWFGQMQTEEYFLNGKKYSREDWINQLKEIHSPHYQEQLMIYQAEQYNL